MRRRFSLASAAALLAACHTTTPTIDEFLADKPTVTPGDTVTLSWKVRGADRLQLDPGAQTVAGTSTTVNPGTTTTYTLTAFNGGRSATASTSVNVVSASTGVPRFWASPAEVLPGATVTLQWSVPAATGVTIESDAGALGAQTAPAGSLQVTVAQTTLYTLRAQYAAGPPSTPMPVRVRVILAPTISSFTADKTSTTAGDQVTLSWQGTATGFGVDNGVGFLGPARSVVVRPARTTTYTLSAFGAAGTVATSTATVNISGPAPGTRSLSYSDPVVTSGAALTLVRDPGSTPSLLVLKLVTTTAVQAGGLAFDLPIDATRVQLDASAPGDTSPGFVVNTAALDPGSAPPAAKAALGNALLANTLAIGLAQKATSPGVVPDKSLAAGTELCRFRFVVAPDAQPGTVMPFGSQPVRALLTHLPRDPSAALTQVAVGTLTLQ